MTDKARKCMESCREWYQAFSNSGKGNERSVKELLTTADLIESLCAELEQVKQERDGLNILLGQAQSMLETRTRERDAAVEDLRKVCQATEVCFCCKSHNTNYTEYVSNDCMDCIRHCNWQWRGVNEDREAPTCQ